MKTIAEIRRKNFAFLVKKNGGITRLAVMLDRATAQVSQWLHGFKITNSERRRAMNDDSARFVEGMLGLAVGWIDHEHSESQGDYKAICTEAQQIAEIVDAMDNDQTRQQALRIVKALAQS